MPKSYGREWRSNIELMMLEKKKYVVDKSLQFQITNDKPIMEQVYIYGNLCDEVLNENMKNCEIRQANVLIVKFPSS